MNGTCRLASHALIEREPCPVCKARGAEGDQPGEPCTTPAGRPALLPHFPRREAAIAAGKHEPQ